MLRDPREYQWRILLINRYPCFIVLLKDRTPKEFEAKAIIGCTLAIGVVITWIFVFIMMLRAVALKQILWPQKQEDRNEGGWLQGDERLRSEDRNREIRIRRVSALRESWKENNGQYRAKQIAAERELSHDRADYAIKESGAGPTRGRARH